MYVYVYIQTLTVGCYVFVTQIGNSAMLSGTQIMLL